MFSCDPQLLGAYHDGELPDSQRETVEQHLRHCNVCTSELRRLQETSNLLRGHSFEDLTAGEHSRLHRSIEQAETPPLFRLVMGLSVIAASVLIVSCAWLMELPPTAGTVAQRRPTRRPEPWEQVATSLRPDPLSLIQDDPIRFADAAVADWMLVGLTGRTLP